MLSNKNIFKLLFVAFFLFTFVSAVHAANYDSIRISPEKVGLMYNAEDKTVQFTAWGVKEGEEDVDITSEVDWYIDPEGYPHHEQPTDPEFVATINIDTGLATANNNWGRVLVYACYPKGCYNPSGSVGSIVPLLLKPELPESE